MQFEAQRKSIKTEVIAGITTFLTMAYIVVVNPAILSTPGTGMPFQGVLTATVTLSFLMTLLMGIYAKLPFGVAPGMGINAFFTFSVILSGRVPWQVALGMVFLAGVLFLLVSVTGTRELIATSIPKNLRVAAAVGIGFFLTFIGLKSAGLVAADSVTFVKLGQLNTSVLISFIGIFIAIYFLRKKNPFAFLISIGFCSAISWLSGNSKLPDQFFSSPDFNSVFFKLDILGALKLSLLPAIISIMFTDFFDSISTFVGVAQAGGLLDEKGNPIRIKQGLIVDAFATLFAGLFGTSSGTAFIESGAGIEVGGRTGLTAIVTAICFLPCLFIGPLIGAIPASATAPVLIVVGALMFQSIKSLDVSVIEDSFPAFLTIILIPLTFSITQGILWGFISHVILYFLVGRLKEVSVTMRLIGLVSIALLLIERFKS